MEGLSAILDEARARLDGSSPAAARLALATVVRARGSTPRKAGACLLVDPLRGSLGTIGGGCGEAEVLARAQRVLASGVPELCEVSLLEEDGFESPSVCGGVLEVWIERLDHEIGGIARESFFRALDSHRGGRGVSLSVVTVVGSRAADARARWLGRKTLIDERGVQIEPYGDDRLDAAAVDLGVAALARGRPVDDLLSSSGLRLLALPVDAPPELVVVGAGHVGAALTALAARSGFRVTVIDDRPSFANPDRLPDASCIVVDHPPRALRGLGPRRDRYVVLVTRGHRLDAECLEVALGLETSYLGMIGSRRRVRRIGEWLGERGADPRALAEVAAPIGLDIGAESPAEIAIAILAEIIDRRRGGRARPAALSR